MEWGGIKLAWQEQHNFDRWRERHRDPGRDHKVQAGRRMPVALRGWQGWPSRAVGMHKLRGLESV